MHYIKKISGIRSTWDSKEYLVEHVRITEKALYIRILKSMSNLREKVITIQSSESWIRPSRREDGKSRKENEKVKKPRAKWKWKKEKKLRRWGAEQTKKKERWTLRTWWLWIMNVVLYLIKDH